MSASVSIGDLVIYLLQEFQQLDWDTFEVRLEAQTIPDETHGFLIEVKAGYHLKTELDKELKGMPARIKHNEGSNLAGNVTQVPVGINIPSSKQKPGSGGGP